MSLDCSQEVIGDLEKVLETNEGYDVIICAGEKENVKELRAHSSILSIRSQYFRTAFSKEWENKKDGKLIFEKPNISPQIFEIILRFIYTGKIDLAKLQGPEVLKLLLAIDELNFHTLIPRVQEYLIKHQDKFLQQNPIDVLQTVYQHESFTDLWDYCLETICENPSVLFDSDNFTSLKAPLLELLLKRDDLCLDEIVVWDNLLKWSIAQNPSVSQDTSTWSKEDITIMERTLHGFVPFVRFYHISSQDFVDKIFPLKELLPKDLADELLKFNIAPNKPNIDEIQPPRQSKLIYDSTLIERQHFAIIASWIDKKESSHYKIAKDIPYNFNLLYRASRDGNAPAAFHKKCDDKGATIVVAKLANLESIVGGYNPFPWESSVSWKSTSDSFMYFFPDRRNIVTAKVGYSNGNKFSIGNNSNHGPMFGGGWDLYYDGHDVWCSNKYKDMSYPNLAGMPKRNAKRSNFNSDDYEVFQVIRK